METLTLSTFWLIVLCIIHSIGLVTIVVGLTKLILWLYELGQAIIDQRNDNDVKSKYK